MTVVGLGGGRRLCCVDHTFGLHIQIAIRIGSPAEVRRRTAPVRFLAQPAFERADVKKNHAFSPKMPAIGNLSQVANSV
ncbi:MAG: hypothetical protein ACREP7_12695 [Lysobacter sp.]